MKNNRSSMSRFRCLCAGSNEKNGFEVLNGQFEKSCAETYHIAGALARIKTLGGVLLFVSDRVRPSFFCYEIQNTFS